MRSASAAVSFPFLPHVVYSEAGALNDQTVTYFLRAADAGDPAALEHVYACAYDELRRLAHTVRLGAGSPTLDTTALVHEAYLKLVPGGRVSARDRVHFFRIAARAMRQVLIDAARRRLTRRRNEAALGIELLLDEQDRVSADVIELEKALSELETLSPRQANVVECRFYAGLSVEETADALGVSAPTVKRDWRVARAWLSRALTGSMPDPS